MSFFRSILLRYWLGVLLIPGYLSSLGAEQRADGLFDRWFSLTMPFHFADEVQQDIRQRIQDLGTVSEALETASVWAAQHDEHKHPADPQAHQPLFSLLIGEWKQFRNVNSAATPVKLPEWREVKLALRTSSALFTLPNLGFDATYKGLNAICSLLPTESAPVVLTPLPLISGMAIAAP